MKYLALHHARTNLGLGMSIEQLIDASEHSQGRVLRWVCIDYSQESEFVVSEFKAFEDESASSDIYGLYAVESDSDGGAQQAFSAPEEHEFDSADDAIDFVVSKLGGSPEHFLNQGFLEEDYGRRFASGPGNLLNRIPLS